MTGYVSLCDCSPAGVAAGGCGLVLRRWRAGDAGLDAAEWDLVIANQSLLTPASYRQLETAMTLKTAVRRTTVLGVYVRNFDGHVMLEHGGEVGGYVAENIVFPEDNAAVVVLTNEVASEAASEIASEISKLLFPAKTSPTTVPSDTFAPELQKLLTELQNGQVDRSALTSNCNAYFTPATLADFQSTLAPLGKIVTVTRTSTSLRGGMTYGSYKAVFSNGAAVAVSTYRMSDGKVEQLLVVGKS